MLLRAARDLSGKTQAEVAKEIGISEISYQRIEYDKQTPRLHTAIKIAHALGATVEELFGAATPEAEKEPDGNPAQCECTLKIPR